MRIKSYCNNALCTRHSFGTCGVGTGGVWCAPSEVEKKNWSKFARFRAFFLPKAPTRTQASHLYKNREGRIPHLNGALLIMLIYLSFSFLAPSFLSSFSLFSSFLSSFPFLFWYPFSDPGAIRPWSALVQLTQEYQEMQTKRVMKAHIKNLLLSGCLCLNIYSCWTSQAYLIYSSKRYKV